jgi:tetratricopeptide (TPR) repeat protein
VSPGARRWLLPIVALVAIGGGYAAFRVVQTSALGERIPRPDEFARRSSLDPVVVEHLRARYDAAVAEPDSIAALGPLCIAYHADMLLGLAERCYALAEEVDSGDWRWTYSRALIQAERGGGGELTAVLRDVVSRAPQFSPAWLRLGEAEFKASRYDAAGEAYRQAVDLPEPDRVTVADTPPYVAEVPVAAYGSLGLARVALVRGDPDAARTLLEPLIVAQPAFSPAYRLLAESYRASGRTDDADRLVLRAGRLPPFTPYQDPIVDALARESRNSTLLLRLASEATLSVNASWSEYLTRRALEFDPDNPDVVVKLGRILRTIGRNDEALTLFERYHQMVPAEVQGLAHIGSALSALGRYTEAETFFRRALAGRDDPVTHYNLGLLMSLRGRPDEAIREYELALAGDALHVDARINLATALARKGDVGRAVRELTTVVDQEPGNAAARTNLGILLIQLGRADRAARELEEALRLDPRLVEAAQALESIHNLN